MTGGQVYDANGVAWPTIFKVNTRGLSGMGQVIVPGRPEAPLSLVPARSMRKQLFQVLKVLDDLPRGTATDLGRVLHRVAERIQRREEVRITPCRFFTAVRSHVPPCPLRAKSLNWAM